MFINQLLQPIGFLMLLIGLAVCFFGYEIYKAFIRVTGFFIGALIGLILPVFFNGSLDTSLILALIFGILGAILAVPLNFLFLFLEGGLNGALITMGVMFLFGTPPANSMGIAAVGFILAGILVVAFKIGFTIISTSVSGSLGMVLGVAFLSPSLLFNESPIIFIMAIIFISGIGMLVQFSRLDGRKKALPITVSAPLAYAPPPRLNGVPAASPAEVPCPNCRWLIPVGSTRCGHCGEWLVSPPSVEVPCPNCQHLNPTWGTYCGMCGHLLQPGLPGGVPCPNCKHLNPSGCSYCAMCGCPLTEMAPQIQALPANRSNPGDQLPVAHPEPLRADVICPKCGVRNAPGSTYCMECGTNMKLQQQNTI